MMNKDERVIENLVNELLASNDVLSHGLLNMWNL